MVAVVRLRKGTRDHAVYIRGEKFEHRSQSAALAQVRALVRLGIVTTVYHLSR